MKKPFDIYRYGLLKIDVTDTYIKADSFDNKKYLDCIRSNNIEELLDYAVINFSKENPEMKSYFSWL